MASSLHPTEIPGDILAETLAVELEGTNCSILIGKSVDLRFDNNTRWCSGTLGEGKEEVDDNTNLSTLYEVDCNSLVNKSREDELLVKLLSCVNGRPSVQTVFGTNGLVWLRLKEVNRETLWTTAEVFGGVLVYLLTNVALETLISTITKGDGELDGDSLDGTWSRFE